MSNQGYQNWMREVDYLLTQRFGFCSHHLEDFLWRDEYDSETTPEDAVQAFVDYYPEYYDLEGGEA